MAHPCSECRRPASFLTRKNRLLRARRDHDLCLKCFRKLLAKVAAEEVVKNLCDLHKVEWVTCVPHNVYGPGQRFWDPYRNVAGIMLNRVLSGKRPIVYGDGSQRRCLSFISDVTGPLLKLATEDVAVEATRAGAIGQAGRTRVLQSYSWDAHLSKIDRYLNPTVGA